MLVRSILLLLAAILLASSLTAQSVLLNGQERGGFFRASSGGEDEFDFNDFRFGFALGPRFDFGVGVVASQYQFAVPGPIEGTYQIVEADWETSYLFSRQYLYRSSDSARAGLVLGLYESAGYQADDIYHSNGFAFAALGLSTTFRMKPTAKLMIFLNGEYTHRMPLEKGSTAEDTFELAAVIAANLGIATISIGPSARIDSEHTTRGLMFGIQYVGNRKHEETY